MRYQQYKNRMLKIRKIIDFFYRFRFVFAAVITVIIAGAITLDVTKGNITETSSFEISYKYGEDFTYSGEAFMGEVTYEFRKVGTEEWTEKKPRYVGTYEARAKSKGSHGYKYSDVSTFSITKIDTPISIIGDNVNFGEDKPALSYSLLNGDTLMNYRVNYGDLTKTTTTADIDLNSLVVLDKDNVNVTDCYNFITETKNITFNKIRLAIHFKNHDAYAYNGVDSFSNDAYEVSGTILPGMRLEVSGGRTESAIGTYQNTHTVRIVDENDPTIDYTDNYNIVKTGDNSATNDNNIVIRAADAITVSSSSPRKTYNGEPFPDSEFTYEISGILPIHHEVVTFTKKDTVNATTGVSNDFNVQILDSNNQDVSSCYQDVIKRPGTIKIDKINVEITSRDKTYLFDNTYKDEQGFDYDETVMVSGDTVIRDNYPSKKDPGTYTNGVDDKTDYHVENSAGQDVTQNYNLIVNRGTLTIEKKPLKFVFKGHNQDYDGEYHNVYGTNNTAILDPTYEANLPQDWTYEVTAYSDNGHSSLLRMKDFTQNGYKADETKVETHIYDASHVDVTSYFTVDNTTATNNNNSCDVTFEFETSNINKVPLTVNTVDYGSKVYNNQTIGDSFDERNAITPMVTSSGLIGDDYLDVQFKESDASLKNVKAAGSYSVNYEYRICSPLYGEVTQNYSITHTPDNKKSSDITIQKKDIYITTPNISKTYDGGNILPLDQINSMLTDSSFISFTNFNAYDYYTNGIGETVELKSGTYGGPITDAFPTNHAVYSISSNDLVIKMGTTDVTSNYNVHLQCSGEITINKRDMYITQKSNTVDYIYYDGNYHGVYTGSNEVEVQDKAGNQGLLTNLNHYVSFEAPQSTNLTGVTTISPINSSYLGTKVYEPGSPDRDITENYNISYNVGSFRINIIKKRISITSKGDTKTFDGNPNDVMPLMNAYPAYYDITTDQAKSYFTWHVYDDYNGIEVDLNTGHKLMVTKTRQSILDMTVDVGSYSNAYDFKVVDENDPTIDYTDYYTFDIYNGVLTTEPLKIKAYCYGGSKTYDGTAFTRPADVVEVNTASSASGASLYLYNYDDSAVSSTTRNTFFNNFKVKAYFTPASTYDNYFMAGNYSFNAVFKFYYANGNSYSPGSNIQLTVEDSSYDYSIGKVSITITCRIQGSRELRYISFGKLISGDDLYFGEEKWTTRNWQTKPSWAAPFNMSNIDIKRGNISVKSCYDITLNQ